MLNGCQKNESTFIAIGMSMRLSEWHSRINLKGIFVLRSVFVTTSIEYSIYHSIGCLKQKKRATLSK